jgi:hypothetical protein
VLTKGQKVGGTTSGFSFGDLINQLDPELAALLAGSDASTSLAEAEEPAPDPDLEQLLKDLEG